ncbi:MAG: hypothetical protein ACRCYY_20345 [Trueperaceae bacterium]
MKDKLQSGTNGKQKTTKSSMLHTRVPDELRRKVERYATHHGVSVSQVMVNAVEALLASESVRGNTALEQTSQIPNRILDIERRFGLSVFESVKSLEDFGICTVLDLTTPEGLAKGINTSNLKTFVQIYEVRLDWLLTGEGPVYKPTHHHWHLLESAKRIQTLFLTKQLKAVWLVMNESSLNLTDIARFQLVLETTHPKLGDEFSVYESFAHVNWQQRQSDILLLIRFCTELYEATRNTKVYPCGRTLKPQAHEQLEAGWLCIPQAFRETTFAWHPQQNYAKYYEVALGNVDENNTWQMLKIIVKDIIEKG